MFTTLLGCRAFWHAAFIAIITVTTAMVSPAQLLHQTLQLTVSRSPLISRALVFVPVVITIAHRPVQASTHSKPRLTVTCPKGCHNWSSVSEPTHFTPQFAPIFALTRTSNRIVPVVSFRFHRLSLASYLAPFPLPSLSSLSLSNTTY